MSEIPSHLKYANTHEWVKIEGNIAVIGITDHAQDSLDDIVFCELPKVEQEVEAGEECVVIESVKTASDVHSPLTGKVVEINKELDDTPEWINESPYERAWLFKLIPSNLDEEWGNLLTANDYAAQIGEELE
jgi:glycine cleavage system H protein